MGGLAAAITLWAYLRLPETLHPEYRRPLSIRAVVDGFRIVVTNRVALFYGLSGMFLFGAMFGFITASQQIFVDIYGLGALFPVAFAVMAGTMAVAQFVNSRIVKRFGMRRLSHLAIVVYLTMAVIWLALALLGPIPLPIFFTLFLIIQVAFGWAASNMNSLSMEPLGAVAGTAASVFGFTQTVGGALLGTYIGQHFDGTLIPNAIGYTVMGLAVLTCILIAEKGKLFGVGAQYATDKPVND
jgi:DHA1 family bicyclomycin/chloramphenicol resistance-like MFS transporter